MKYSFIDVHSHIHGVEFDSDREQILTHLKEEGGATIAIGTDFTLSEKALHVAQKYSHVYAAVGIHPLDKQDEVFVRDRFIELASDKKCVAIGECGLDYFWHPSFTGNKDADVDRQRDLFCEQIEVAVLLDKPLIIHGRPSKKDPIDNPNGMDAYEDIIFLLKKYKEKYGEKLRGDVHFFVGDIEIAKQFLELGFSMSFTGVITFTHQYDEVIKFLPITSILSETDAPYVAPVPHRGRRCEPIYVRSVVEKLAELKNVSIEEMNRQILLNASKLFTL